MALFGGKRGAAGIGGLLIGAIGAAFLGRMIFGFLGAFGAIGMLIVGVFLARSKFGGGIIGNVVRMTGVALAVAGAGGLVGG